MRVLHIVLIFICTHLHPEQPVPVPMSPREASFVVTGYEAAMDIAYVIQQKVVWPCNANRNEHTGQGICKSAHQAISQPKRKKTKKKMGEKQENDKKRKKKKT